MFTRYFTERKSATLPVLTVLVLVLLAGCANNTTSTTASLTTSIKSTATSSTNLTSASATLKHMPVGNASFNWDHTSHMLTVQIIMTGLAPDSIHPTQIYTGTCNSLGKVAYPLENLAADSHGAVNATSKVSVPNGIPAQDWALNIHNGPGVSTADEALSIVCGNIANHDTSLRSSQAVQVPLTTAPASSKGENASGTATLSISGHTLKVELTLTGLEPNSQHMAHIHTGSCSSQGPVLYPLPVIKANAAGKATLTTTIQNVTTIPSTGWYVNVHRGIDLSTQSGFDPISCGDVTAVHP